MDTFKLLKIMSSESKAKIIALHMYCNCDHKVLDLCSHFNLQQANGSKHLSSLTREGVLQFSKDGKEVYYKINPSFKKEWGHLIGEIIKKDSTLTKYAACKSCK